jgi:hypothetical protein
VRVEHCPDSLGVPASGDHSVARREGRLGDVHTHAPASTGDQPDLLLSHVPTSSITNPRPRQRR